MFDSLSRQTRFFRFMYVQPEMSFPDLKKVTRIDYQTSMKVVAELLDFEWVERYGLDIIGFGGYEEIVDDDPFSTTAEVSVVIADAWQDRGVGKRLFAHILDVARKSGYTTLLGEMLVENHKMKRLMQELGYDVRFECADGVRHFRIDLSYPGV